MTDKVMVTPDLELHFGLDVAKADLDAFRELWKRLKVRPVITHPMLTDGERLLSAVALDYHDYAIECDDTHPAVTWARCTAPKCAAIRRALGGN